MKLLTAVLVLLVASSHVIATDSTVNPSSTVPTTIIAASSPEGSSIASVATTPGGSASTVYAGTGPTSAPVSTATDGSTASPGSTVTDGSNTGSTSGVPTTTPTPMKLSTFPVSNSVTPLDAKLILQHAVQLDQQIKALNEYLLKAQADTNPENSPLFGQLNAFSTNITNQNATLQGYLTQLQTLTTSQATLDTRVNSATNTFVCFSQSSCVTDVPTTPVPTTPGPPPPVTPCTPTTLTTDSDYTVIHFYTFNNTRNVDLCHIDVQASKPGNNVSITINVTLSGPNSYVTLVEKRSQQNVTFLNSTSNYNFQGFQEVDVYYYACPYSTVQFNFDYQEVNNCLLDCHAPNGTCKVSTSGEQYCECTPCEFTGKYCDTALPDPCNAKQRRLCGGTNSTLYGTCYKNTCFDQCYACECIKSDPASEQKCIKPDESYNAPPPTPATYTCPSTVAPTTTTALLTSTPIASSSPTSSAAPGSTAQPGSPGTTASSWPSVSTPSAVSSTSGGGASTEAGSPSSPVASTIPSTEAAPSSTNAPTPNSPSGN